MEKFLLIYRYSNDTAWRKYVLNSRDKAMNMLNKLSKNPAIVEKQLKRL